MKTTTNAATTETKRYMTARDIRNDLYILEAGRAFKIYSRANLSYEGLTGVAFETDMGAFQAKMNYVRRYADKFDR